MVKKKFLVLCLFCLMDFPLLQAEDGSKLWLRDSIRQSVRAIGDGCSM